MKKHMNTLEDRRGYLASRLADILSHPGNRIFESVWQEEKDALDWALGKLAEPEPTQLVLEMDPDTGEVICGVVEPVTSRTFAPIGNTGYYGPIRVGAVVQALAPVTYADIMKGEIGKLTDFDSWAGEEYPYIATFDGGRSAAFAREDIRRVD